MAKIERKKVTFVFAKDTETTKNKFLAGQEYVNDLVEEDIKFLEEKGATVKPYTEPKAKPEPKIQPKAKV